MNEETLLRLYGSPYLTDDIMNFGMIHTGDQTHVLSDSWLGHEINKNMRKQQIDHNIPLLDHKNWIGSHSGMNKWDCGTLWVYGAIANGYKPLLYREAYSCSNHAIFRPEVPYNPMELKILVDYINHLDSINWSYQYWGLLQQWLLINWGWNWFNHNNEKFLYCYEGNKRCLNAPRPNPRLNLEIASYFDLRFQKEQLILDYRINY